MAPTKVPTDIVATLSRAMDEAVKNPRFADVIEKRGSTVAERSPAFFAQHLERERQRVERTVVKTGLRLD